MTTRTPKQNNSLHLYIRLLSKAMQDAGLDMREVITVEIPASEYLVKEQMIKPIAKFMFGVDSTADLTTAQISELYEVVNRATAERLGISVDWPTDEPPLLGMKNEPT